MAPVLLQGVARDTAQLAGQVHLECEWRARLVREEQAQWVATGARQLLEAEGLGREGTARAALVRPRVLQCLVRHEWLTVRHADMHGKRMAEAQPHKE